MKNLLPLAKLSQFFTDIGKVSNSQIPIWPNDKCKPLSKGSERGVAKAVFTLHCY
jgi:hypothetical protein